MSEKQGFLETQTRPLYCPRCGSEDAEIQVGAVARLHKNDPQVWMKLTCHDCDLIIGTQAAGHMQPPFKPGG